MTRRVKRILGVAYFGNHDSSVALLEDGVLVAATEEERFTRVKFDRSFPEHSIEFCLKQAGITIHDIDEVGFFWQPWKGVATRALYALRGLPSSLGRGSKNAGVLLDLLSAERVFRQKTGYTGPFHFLEHHLAHAASTFFSSGYEKAAILSVDGTGETATCWIGEGEGNRLTNHQTTRWPHSLGHVYATATQYLGFKVFSDEYKVMGLSALGSPVYLDTFREIIRVRDGAIVIDLRYTDYQYAKERWYSTHWLETFGRNRLPGELLEERHKNVAASLQARTEEVLQELASYAVKRSGCDSLCLSGGVSLNAVAVGKLARSGICKRVFTTPVASDSGCALGAALYLYHRMGHAERHSLPHAFWGISFSDASIEAELQQQRMTYERLAHPARTAAELIAQGLVVGWFQGRAEYGQRALGNRSILADPRDPHMKDRINSMIKQRESFRPFAPAILAEHQHEYFSHEAPVPFMTEVHPIRPDKRDLIPAVMHVDGTARLQTVERSANPLFADLIQEFYTRTGIPLVLNTSFNVNGEPIVNSPGDALSTFKKTGLDAVILGSFLVRRENLTL